ncbi:hypothetical protein T02_5207 [Trichinella nativa]|uniref:Reverse transcriptase/retrotransposon-derived protein RNase H-like domain-containing protein n=1 Tax=Trichinella nativa TaxID=6335 RepID=A0A0V1KS77_9BILA|nr:hypothetical protein T02_5207 [Trichinella nativa]
MPVLFDFRKLNNVIWKDAHTLPRFCDTLDALAGARWFLASTWQADTGRLMSNNKIGRRRHSPPPLGFFKAHGDSSERPGGLRLLGVPGRCHHFLQNCRRKYGTTTRGIPPPPELEAPTCVSKLRQFMGLAWYYRKFVKGFANVAALFHRLLEKGAEWDWSKDCQSAFDALNFCAGPLISGLLSAVHRRRGRQRRRPWGGAEPKGSESRKSRGVIESHADQG